MTYSYAGHDACIFGTLRAIQGVDIFSRNCSQKSAAVCIPSLYVGHDTLICGTWITGCRRLFAKTFAKVACSVDCMTSHVGPGSLVPHAISVDAFTCGTWITGQSQNEALSSFYIEFTMYNDYRSL